MLGRSAAARAMGPPNQVEHARVVAIEEVPTFEAIYQQHFDFVWASARRLGVSASSMDDVVQEIFLVIHAKVETLRQPSSLRSWIYGVVRRTVSDHHRSQRSRHAGGEALAVEAGVRHRAPPTPHDLTEQSDEIKVLFALLEKIDFPKREVFMLAELEEMTVPEIAEALEIPLNTAYSRLRAARIAFGEELARSASRDAGGRP